MLPNVSVATSLQRIAHKTYTPSVINQRAPTPVPVMSESGVTSVHSSRPPSSARPESSAFPPSSVRSDSSARVDPLVEMMRRRQQTPIDARFTSVPIGRTHGEQMISLAQAPRAPIVKRTSDIYAHPVAAAWDDPGSYGRFLTTTEQAFNPHRHDSLIIHQDAVKRAKGVDQRMVQAPRTVTC
jgi:hypothetical protein